MFADLLPLSTGTCSMQQLEAHPLNFSMHDLFLTCTKQDKTHHHAKFYQVN
jgi:hypothetical protein